MLDAIKLLLFGSLLAFSVLASVVIPVGVVLIVLRLFEVI